MYMWVLVVYAQIIKISTSVSLSYARLSGRGVKCTCSDISISISPYFLVIIDKEMDLLIVRLSRSCEWTDTVSFANMIHVGTYAALVITVRDFYES